jgi:transposase
LRAGASLTQSRGLPSRGCLLGLSDRWEAPVFIERTSVGLDVHARSVAAPSKLQRSSGDRVKTDQRNAMHLARVLRLDDVTSVTVPSIDREAARDLVRAREDCRGDLMRARHRVSKLLLRHGIVYSGGQAWTGRQDAWLRAQHLPTLATRLAFDEGLDAVLTVAAVVTAWMRRSPRWPPSRSSPRSLDGWAVCAGSPP